MAIAAIGRRLPLEVEDLVISFTWDIPSWLHADVDGYSMYYDAETGAYRSRGPWAKFSNASW